MVAGGFIQGSIFEKLFATQTNPLQFSKTVDFSNSSLADLGIFIIKKKLNIAAADSIVMLPSDMEMVFDKSFLPYTKLYAADEALFHKHFGFAYGKLLEVTLNPVWLGRFVDVDFHGGKTPGESREDFKLLQMKFS